MTGITEAMLHIANNPTDDWLKKFNPMLFEKQVVTTVPATKKVPVIHHDLEIVARDYDANDSFIKHLATKVKG